MQSTMTKGNVNHRSLVYRDSCHQYRVVTNINVTIQSHKSKITIFHSDMQFELDENQFITLSFVLGYNKSDASYGWNGFKHGAELYFSHITDEIMDTAQSIPLTAGLQPVISLQNIQKTYLGSPYTACTGSFHS